jgi:hypothetical protein
MYPRFSGELAGMKFFGQCQALKVRQLLKIWHIHAPSCFQSNICHPLSKRHFDFLLEAAGGFGR